MIYKKATKEDLGIILDLVKEAQKFLKEQGVHQWQDGYPGDRDIIKDLIEQESFLFYEGGVAIGYMTIVLHPEESYNKLLEGEWLNKNQTEGAMHHVIISKLARGKGLSKELFDLGIHICRIHGKESIRIDTHPDNSRMQHVICKNNFHKCGVIQLQPSGDLRLVYEQKIKRLK